MAQMQVRVDCSAGNSSGQERAARVWQLVVDGARIPSMQRGRFKRLRDRAGQPTALARLLADIEVLPALGVRQSSAMHLPLVVTQAIELAYAAKAPAVVTREMIERDMSLNLAETIASLRAIEEDTPEAHDRAAEQAEAEIVLQQERARLHRQRAADLRRAR